VAILSPDFFMNNFITFMAVVSHHEAIMAANRIKFATL